MPTLDTPASTAVAGPAFAAAHHLWIDFLGDPLRVTTFGKDLTFASTGDSDLDGNTFLSFDHRAVQVGDVAHSENGSDTLQITLSGIESIDADLMTEIADTTKWRGRTVRIWMQIYDEAGASPQGAVIPYYTGYASSVTVLPAVDGQTIQLSVENYLAIFNQPSNRSYLGQKNYDSSDNSAQATLAAANMARGAATSTSGMSGGSSDYGSSAGGYYGGQTAPTNKYPV